MPLNLREYIASHPNKHNLVKSFPTMGKSQIPGVVCSDLSDGTYIAEIWINYLIK